MNSKIFECVLLGHVFDRPKNTNNAVYLCSRCNRIGVTKDRKGNILVKFHYDDKGKCIYWTDGKLHGYLVAEKTFVYEEPKDWKYKKDFNLDEQ